MLNTLPDRPRTGVLNAPTYHPRMPHATAEAPPPAANSTVHRIEVRPRAAADDPRARAVAHQAAAIGLPVSGVRTARVYLIEAPLAPAQLAAVRDRLLPDPVAETATIGVHPPDRAAAIIEVHPLPGVMDPVA